MLLALQGVYRDSIMGTTAHQAILPASSPGQARVHAEFNRHRFSWMKRTPKSRILLRYLRKGYAIPAQRDILAATE
jgi:hypothetical protein